MSLRHVVLYMWENLIVIEFPLIYFIQYTFCTFQSNPV